MWIEHHSVLWKIWKDQIHRFTYQTLQAKNKHRTPTSWIHDGLGEAGRDIRLTWSHWLSFFCQTLCWCPTKIHKSSVNLETCCCYPPYPSNNKGNSSDISSCKLKIGTHHFQKTWKQSGTDGKTCSRTSKSSKYLEPTCYFSTTNSQLTVLCVFTNASVKAAETVAYLFFTWLHP